MDVLSPQGSEKLLPASAAQIAGEDGPASQDQQ